ncbi:MAG: dTDP-4-dehydrorhamnose reductase [Parachlamydiales bacterium]|jgi:dTDP-4-dehydrorhamnose reductase
MKRILLIGKNGQIGWELHRTLSALGEVFATDYDTLDLKDAATIRATVQKVRPHIIVNAGAYTSVDKAESELDLNNAVNSKGPAILADEARKSGAILVHFSTDYIFDGTAQIPYSETAASKPLSAYGSAKLQGELAIVNSGCKYLIFRTSWIYSNRGKNFLLTMLSLAQTKPIISVVNDQIGAPTWARSVAEGTALALHQVMYTNKEEKWGTYNMSCAGKTTWYEFTQEIFRLCPNPQVEIQPIPTTQYPTPAKRPAFSLLDNQKILNTFNISLPHWKQALELCLQERTTV